MNKSMRYVLKKLCIISACTTLLSACSQLPQRDFFTLLPEDSTEVCTISTAGKTLRLTSCRKGEQFIIHVTDCSALQEREHGIEAVLVRQAYGSLWGREAVESLENCVSEKKENSLMLSIPAERLRHDGDPWDYSLRLVLHSPDGNGEVVVEYRLYSRCPAPGVLRSNPDLFDRTFSRNHKRLQTLRAAAARCHSARLLTEDFHSKEKIDRLFNAEETSELCRLITRMRPVCTQRAMVNPAGVYSLRLLDAQGKLLEEFAPNVVSPAGTVSPENVALMRCFVLSDADADRWYHLLRLR